MTGINNQGWWTGGYSNMSGYLGDLCQEQGIDIDPERLERLKRQESWALQAIRFMEYGFPSDMVRDQVIQDGKDLFDE